ncbi:hypothetical protein [Paenibacillus macquariensis]|nr:hypothetical protein [Paenibacillus macquariensis]
MKMTMSEYNRFENIVERFINPLPLSKGDSNERLCIYIVDSKEVKDEVKKKFFFNNPKKLDEVVLFLDVPNRIRIGKLICGLTNKDIIESFPTLGGSNSGGMLSRIFKYGDSDSDTDTDTDVVSMSEIPYRFMISIMTEIPPIYFLDENNSKNVVDEFWEYSALNVKLIKLNELDEVLISGCQDALKKLRENISYKKLIYPFVVIYENNKIYINVHYQRDLYEIRILAPTGQVQFKRIIQSISSTKPMAYYYSPTILRGYSTKICFIGTYKNDPKKLLEHITEISLLTSVYFFNKPPHGF